MHATVKLKVAQTWRHFVSGSCEAGLEMFNESLLAFSGCSKPGCLKSVFIFRNSFMIFSYMFVILFHSMIDAEIRVNKSSQSLCMLVFIVYRKRVLVSSNEDAAAQLCVT